MTEIPGKTYVSPETADGATSLRQRVLNEEAAGYIAEAHSRAELMSSPYEEDQEKTSALCQLLEEMPQAEGEVIHYFKEAFKLTGDLEAEGRERYMEEDANGIDGQLREALKAQDIPFTLIR